MAIAALGLAYVLATRGLLEVNILHNRNPVFILLSDGSIRNGYVVKILNKKLYAQRFVIHIEGIPGLEMQIAGEKSNATKLLVLTVPPNGLESVRLFLRTKTENLSGEQTPFQFIVRDTKSDETVRHDATFYQAKK